MMQPATSYRWDKDLNSKLIEKMPSSVTGAIFSKDADGINKAVVTCIGVLPPIDVAKGQVIEMNLDGKNKKQVYS